MVESADSGIESADSTHDSAANPLRIGLLVQALNVRLKAHTHKARGGDLVLSLPGCVCPKVKDMGPFWASRE